MSISQKIMSIAWWKWIAGINLFFIIFTSISYHFSYFPGRFYFYLGYEMNIATWWSGICLLVLSLLAYELFCAKIDETRKAWLSLSIIFLGLSWDEIGSLHERIMMFSGGWYGLLPFGLVSVILITYSLINLFRKLDTRKPAAFIFSGFIMFGTVVFQEYLEFSINWPYWMKGIRMGIEEGTELFAILLILFGVIKQRNKLKVSDPLITLIPNPFLMKYLPSVLFFGMVIHSVASIFVPFLSDLDMRGNPGVCYPASLYFFLFSASFWISLETKGGERKYWTILSVFFIVCSIGAIRIPLKLLPSYYFYMCQLPLVVFFYSVMHVKTSRNNTILLISLAFLLLLGILVNSSAMQLIISGIFVYSISKIFVLDFLPLRQKHIVS